MVYVYDICVILILFQGPRI